MSHPGYISWAQSRGSKLGYYRASVSCDYCRKRKRRCRPGPAGDAGGCGNCVRLGRKCIAVKVEVMKALDSLGEVATPDNIARAQRSIGHIKSDMPVISQVTHHHSSPSSESQYEAPLLRHNIVNAPQSSMFSPSSYFQSKPGLQQQGFPASLEYALPTDDEFHWQANGHDFASSQFTPLSTTTSTFNESPSYLEQGQHLQSEFGSQLPGSEPFPDWTNNEFSQFTMLLPMTSNLWDLNVADGYIDRDAMGLGHPSLEPGNSFK